MMNSMRRIVLCALAGAMPWVSSTALAQSGADFPNRPMRILTPYTTGGMTDTITRSIAQHLSERLGQPMVVENRVGANGAIAMEQVAKGPADGYTLLLASITNYVFLPASKKSLPFDTIKDFSSVTMASTAPMYLVVHPSVPARTVQELISLARAQPGKINYASSGFGSSQHLIMELFKLRTGTNLFHVPYKGSAPSVTDMLAGQVQVMFEGPTSTIPYIQSGKFRALASSVMKRTRAMPNVPTVSESGVPGFDFSTWSGIVVAAATARAIVTRLNTVAGEMLRNPALIDKFAAQNIDLLYSTPEEMDERIRAELPLFVKVMREAGIQPD